MKINYITNPFKIGRSKKDVPLDKILATSQDMKNELKKTIDRAVSVSEDEIDKAMDRHEVGTALNDLVIQLNEIQSTTNQISLQPLYNMTKTCRIRKITELRRYYFELDNEARSVHEAEARREFNVRYPDFALDSSAEQERYIVLAMRPLA